jgi:hypothetical protein
LLTTSLVAFNFVVVDADMAPPGMVSSGGGLLSLFETFSRVITPRVIGQGVQGTVFFTLASPVIASHAFG